MNKFKVGQKVKFKTSKARRWSPWPSHNLIYRIDKTNNNEYYYIDVLDDWFHEMSLISATCPVCEKEIQIENNKIVEHTNNNQLCYGSYMPEIV